MEAPAKALSAWGLSAETVAPDAWEHIVGMERERELMEKKILWPVLHPQLANKPGQPPVRRGHRAFLPHRLLLPTTMKKQPLISTTPGITPPDGSLAHG